jgi:hypothetical protein
VFSLPPENSDHLRWLREKLRQDTRDSFQLLQNFWDNPICSINHDEANHCIIVVWNQSATQIQLRYIHENLLTLICKHRVYKILGDDTALPAIPSEDRFWIIDEWFPRPWNAACALPPVKGLPPILATSPSATSSRRLLPASSAGPSSSCTKPGNGSRPWRPGRLTSLRTCSRSFE